MPRTYAFLCGNLDCPSRQQPRWFDVTDEEMQFEGEVWVCDDCRRKQKAS